MLRKNEKERNERTRRIRINDIGAEGEGVGQINGAIVFVEGGIPGDLLDIIIVKEKRNYSYGKLINIVEPSPDRIDPPCPVFGRCGGCSLQHITYSAQLDYKRNKVKNAIKRIGGIDIPVNNTIGMSYPFFYRNKAQFPFGLAGGSTVIGFFSRRSHRIVPVTNCIIQDQACADILKSIEDFANRFNIPPYDEAAHSGLLRHVLLRISHNTSNIMVCIIINGLSLPHENELVNELKKFKSIKSIILHTNTNQTNVILAKDAGAGRVLFGSSYISDRIGELSFQVSPLSFLQVNPVQTKLLYDTVLEFADLKPDDIVFDIYCGVGTIALYIADSCKQVYGIESVSEAIIDAKKNAVLNNKTNTEFIFGMAENVVPELIEKLKLNPDSPGSPDAVIIDPPRKGCDIKLLHTLVSARIPKLIYVSCDSATLSRDLRVLSEGGYNVVMVQPIDCFPQTSHVETVVLMSNKGGAVLK